MKITMFKVDEWETFGLIDVRFDEKIGPKEGEELVRQEIQKLIPHIIKDYTERLVVKASGIEDPEKKAFFRKVVGKELPERMEGWTYSFKIDHLRDRG
jgi:hypothetical protein